MFTTVFETVFFFVIFYHSDRCSLCDIKVVEGGGGWWRCWRRSPLLSAQSGENSGKVTDSNKSQFTAHHLNTDMSGQGSIEHEKHEVLSQI